MNGKCKVSSLCIQYVIPEKMTVFSGYLEYPGNVHKCTFYGILCTFQSAELKDIFKGGFIWLSRDVVQITVEMTFSTRSFFMLLSVCEGTI